VIREIGLLWKTFAPLEEQLLRAVREVLPAAAAPTFDAQVAAIKLVQRLPPSWSEIDFYPSRRKNSWARVPGFPCTDEFRLAEVSFRVAGKRYKATLSSIAGHIFDFATTPGPRRVAFEAWDEPPSVRLLDDPLRAPTGRRAPEDIPHVWQEFLKQHPNPQGNWVLHDGTSAQRVALDQAVYLILAEREGDAFILYRVEPAGEALYFLPAHDGEPEEIKGDLQSVVGAA
jgi:hypothetical protein